MKISDLVGRTIKTGLDPAQNMSNTTIDNHWHELQEFYDNTTLIAEKKRMELGSAPSIPCNFLYYVAGLTTYCPQLGRPVITGPMSGCYLFRYRLAGQFRVAHVGTASDGDADSEKTRRAKEAWKSFAAQQDDRRILGFNPFNDMSKKLFDDLSAAMRKSSNTKEAIFGIWETNGDAGIATFVKDGQVMKFIGFEKARTRPWSTIKNHAKFI